MFCLVAFIPVVLACGATSPVDNKIAEGKDTTIENYPYHLSLGYSGGHLCGAALIKPNIAITAAHCTRNGLPRNLTIRAGATERANGGKLAKVLKICQHPDYVPPDYDVSVLLLDVSFDLADTIQTIPLQAEDVPAGTLATVTGWGKISPGGSPALVLQVAEVPKVDQEDCARIYRITDRMSCYGYIHGGAGVCDGDSGGPLVVDGKLAGIVSWGYGCGQPKYLGVYANLANEEISNHVDDCINGFHGLL